MPANIKVYDDIIPIISMLSGGKTIDEKVNVSIAIGLFAGKMVTLARAAEFIKAFVRRIYRYTKRQRNFVGRIHRRIRKNG